MNVSYIAPRFAWFLPFVFGLGAATACGGPELCEAEGFGTQCRGAQTAICAPRPARHGGGSVVQLGSCRLGACSTHYGAQAAVCLPERVAFSCVRPTLQAVPANAIVALSQKSSAFAVADGLRIEVFASFGSEPVPVASSIAAEKLAFADVDGDGSEDLVLASSSSGSSPGTVYVAYAKDGAFGAAQPRADADALLDTGDVDEDGAEDLLVQIGSQLHLVFGGARPETVTIAASALSPVARIADVGGDGKKVLIIADLGKALKLEVAVLSVRSDRSVRRWNVPLSEAPNSGSIHGVTVFGTPSTMAIADMDGDSVGDVVLGSSAYNLLVFHGREAGFAKGPVTIPLAEPGGLAAAEGGGVVAALQYSPVLAFARGLNRPVDYVADATLKDRSYPVAPGIYRTENAFVGSCR